MEESKDETFSNLKMDTFDTNTFNVRPTKSTAVFSYYEPQYIFALLVDAIQNMDGDSEIKRDEKKWKLTFQLIKKQNDEELKNKIPTEGCKVTCKLLRVDEEQVCVEFSRTQGSSWFFFDTCKQLKEALSGQAPIEQPEQLKH